MMCVCFIIHSLNSLDMRQIHIEADNLHFPMFEFEFYKIISTNNRIYRHEAHMR